MQFTTLSFSLAIRSEESGTAPRGRKSRESKGPTGSSGDAERGRGERSDRGRSDGRENVESRKTAGWHEGCSENRPIGGSRVPTGPKKRKEKRNGALPIAALHVG